MTSGMYTVTHVQVCAVNVVFALHTHAELVNQNSMITYALKSHLDIAGTSIGCLSMFHVYIDAWPDVQ